jgi:phosphatidylglycerol lysyltransferase
MIANIVRAIQTQLPHLSEEGYEDHAQDKPFRSRMLKKASIFLYTLALLAVIASEAFQLAAPNGSSGKVVTIQLARGPFSVLVFAPRHKKPKAVILFGSGDGGWSGFEEAICRTLQADGYEAVGIDSKLYAATDYNLNILQADTDRIAHTFCGKYGQEPPPLIVGGWSMGAAQAIAAAGGPHPPRGLTGVLVLDPCSRGRYGLRVTDQADLLPTGPGTFSMDEFTKTMGNVRVVQWHAAEDPIDSRTWLKNLTAPHKEFDFGQTGHYYNRDRGDFLTQLVASLSWILGPEDTVITTTGAQG